MHLFRRGRSKLRKLSKVASTLRGACAVFPFYEGPTAIAVEAGEESGRLRTSPPSPRGGTALHWAARWGNVEVVRVLLQHGADLRARASKRRNGGGGSSGKEKSWPAIEEAPPRPQATLAGEPKEREA